MSSLTILRTIQEDEAIYHCAASGWRKDVWRGTYLSLKGNAQRTSDYTVMQRPAVSVHVGDSVTLQCSVLSDFEDKICTGDHNVHWFKAGSDESHPGVIYTNANHRDGCQKRPDSRSLPKSCVYSFSKNVSSSDAGTYYCALATCGEIFFGNGTKLDIDASSDHPNINLVLLVVCTPLAINVLVIASLIHAIRNQACDHCKALQINTAAARGNQWNQQRDNDTRVYSTVVFTLKKAGIKNVKAAKRDWVYTAVRAFGLD
ncbi:hypothetical protein LDENG_00271120 [Lucifuga dentata]|nr:hypothetical protein LDENG_00271120 [Lucifuga dentata]